MVGGRVKYLFGGGPLVPGKVGVVHGHHNALSVSPDSVVSDSLGKTGERLLTKSADALSLSLSVFLQDKLFLLELFLLCLLFPRISLAVYSDWPRRGRDGRPTSNRQSCSILSFGVCCNCCCRFFLSGV